MGLEKGLKVPSLHEATIAEEPRPVKSDGEGQIFYASIKFDDPQITPFGTGPADDFQARLTHMHRMCKKGDKCLVMMERANDVTSDMFVIGTLDSSFQKKTRTAQSEAKGGDISMVSETGSGFKASEDNAGASMVAGEDSSISITNTTASMRTNDASISLGPNGIFLKNDGGETVTMNKPDFVEVKTIRYPLSRMELAKDFIVETRGEIQLMSMDRNTVRMAGGGLKLNFDGYMSTELGGVVEDVKGSKYSKVTGLVKQDILGPAADLKIPIITNAYEMNITQGSYKINTALGNITMHTSTPFNPLPAVIQLANKPVLAAPLGTELKLNNATIGLELTHTTVTPPLINTLNFNPGGIALFNQAGPSTNFLSMGPTGITLFSQPGGVPSPALLGTPFLTLIGALITWLDTHTHQAIIPTSPPLIPSRLILQPLTLPTISKRVFIS